MLTFDAALDFVRAAYPQGVPPVQHPALAELLNRTVGTRRAGHLLEALAVPSEDLLPAGSAAPAVTSSPEDVLDVAARLARAGWPLAGPHPDESPRPPGYVTRVMNWLRADYPNGVPAQDYLPVLAVLRPQLHDDDVAAIAEQLAQDARQDGVPPSEADAREAISRATDVEARPEEIERLRAMLAEDGWSFEPKENHP